MGRVASLPLIATNPCDFWRFYPHNASKRKHSSSWDHGIKRQAIESVWADKISLDGTVAKTPAWSQIWSARSRFKVLKGQPYSEERMDQVTKNGIAQVWAVDLQATEEQLRRLSGLLNDDEQERARRYRFPADRRRFVVARSTLRQILGGCLGMDPASLEFEYGAHGKPDLRNYGSTLRFNLSKSGEKAVVATARMCNIGIDIERLRSNVEVDELAHRFFAPAEVEKLKTFPREERHEAFFRCWTCKEAYIKGVGTGLSLGLDKFDVSKGMGCPGSQNVLIKSFPVEQWVLIPLPETFLDGYLCAVAADGLDLRIELAEWPR